MLGRTQVQKPLILPLSFLEQAGVRWPQSKTHFLKRREKRMLRSKWFVLASLVAAAAMALSACGTPAASPTSAPQVVEVTRVIQGTPETVVITATPGPQEPTPLPAGSVQINGAGATFPFPLYSRWFYDYAFVDASVKFNYQSIGSGGGIKQITEKTVDFGASDAILNDEQYIAAPGIQMLPTVAGAVVPTYNVSELKDIDPLVLDAATLSNIFLGKITRWNDPALTALNPKLPLPDKDIIIVHRSDG